MHVDVTICKWKQLPDDPELFPLGKEHSRPARKRWAMVHRSRNRHTKGEAAPEAETETETGTSAVQTTTATPPGAATEATTAGDGIKKEKQEGDMAGTKEEAADIDDGASDTGGSNGGGGGDDDEKRAQEDIERMDNVLGKREREDQEASDALTKVRNVTSRYVCIYKCRDDIMSR